MKNQPNRNYTSNDVIMTPPELCLQIVEHFAPMGFVLEPACGSGNFIAALQCYNANFGARLNSPGFRPIDDIEWCEETEGRDFFEYSGPRPNYIITNPPWSKIGDWREYSFLESGEATRGQWSPWVASNTPGMKQRWAQTPERKRKARKRSGFLEQSVLLADNVIFLMTVNHAFTSHREGIVRRAGFGLKEIYYVDRPKSFPQIGFLLAAIHWKRGYVGDVSINDGRGAWAIRGAA